MNHELPDVQAGFRKARGTRDQIANIHWIVEKTNKWDLLNIKSFCIANETINIMKRQSTEQEKIFTNGITNRG